MTVIGEIRDALLNGKELFALDRKERNNVYQWTRREKKKGKDAGIIGCSGGEYIVWHEDFSRERSGAFGLPQLREIIAALEHEQWAHWTRYMLDNLTPENIAQWRRQVETPYADLSEKEKDSDREWADKVLEMIPCYP